VVGQITPLVEVAGKRVWGEAWSGHIASGAAQAVIDGAARPCLASARLRDDQRGDEFIREGVVVADHLLSPPRGGETSCHAPLRRRLFRSN